MPRYFIELTYKGTAYSGFQVQENARTIQSEVEQAFSLIHRRPVALTGSSRTDAGVHALQNYFHFDMEEEIHPQAVYKMNAVLPPDIAVKGLYRMPDGAHSRFDAISREYRYRIHRFKNPFLPEVSFYYPYQLDLEVMDRAAALIKDQTDFYAFAKTNSQVRHYGCTILQSHWTQTDEGLVYTIEGNRFLRGMVRLLTATQLKLGRGKIGFGQFEGLFREEGKAGFSVPAHGLHLHRVRFPENYFPATTAHFAGF